MIYVYIIISFFGLSIFFLMLRYLWMLSSLFYNFLPAIYIPFRIHMYQDDIYRKKRMFVYLGLGYLFWIKMSMKHLDNLPPRVNRTYHGIEGQRRSNSKQVRSKAPLQTRQAMLQYNERLYWCKRIFMEVIGVSKLSI